jgi:hypothetical protein
MISAEIPHCLCVETLMKPFTYFFLKGINIIFGILASLDMRQLKDYGHVIKAIYSE